MKHALIWKYHELRALLTAKTLPAGWFALQWEMERIEAVLRQRYGYNISLTTKNP